MLRMLTTRAPLTQCKRVWATSFFVSAISLAHLTQILPAAALTDSSEAAVTQPRVHSTEVPLAQARYFSNDVYLGNYPGFIAPGHKITTTSFIEEGSKLLIHFKAQPYGGRTPIAQLLINGELMTEFTESNGDALEILIPQALTGRLAEVTISFAKDQLPSDGIKLDTARTPVNIPLLRIEAIALIPPEDERRVTKEY